MICPPFLSDFMSEPVCVVSHDAGGANVLARLVRDRLPSAVVCVAGPAVSIFESICPTNRRVELDEVTNVMRRALLGTGWSSSFEFSALREFGSNGALTVSLLDHWVNYEERFRRGGKSFLPQSLLVTDNYAWTIARDTFPTVPIYQIPNPLWHDLRQRRRRVKANQSHERVRILILMEPIREHEESRRGAVCAKKYDEFDCLEFGLCFLNSVPFLTPPVLTLRQHPAETPGKYRPALTLSRHPIGLDEEDDIVESLASADVVLGCESAAMAMAAVAGIPTFTMIPTSLGTLPLPDFGIRSLDSLNLEAQSLFTARA